MAVARRVRFVEAVALERHEEVPESLGFIRRHAAVFDAAIDEENVLLFHLLRDFLTDRFAEFIDFPPRIAGHLNCRHKKVILINQHSVSGVEEIFHLRVKIDGRLLAVLSGDVFLNVVYRTGAVEGDHDVNVVDGVGLEVDEGARHAGAVQLESALGLAAREHGKSLFIVEWDVFDADFFPFDFLDALQSVGDDGEIADAQEVEFQKPRLFDGIHVVLGDDFLFAFGVVLERSVVGQRPGRNNDSSGVYRDVAGVAFNFLRHIHDGFRVRVFFIKLFEVRILFHGAFDGHREALRAHGNQFGNPVADRVREIHGPGHVTHGAAGHHGAEGADLGHMVDAVFRTGVSDDFVPAVVGEVHIDIGRRGSVGI